MFSIVNTMIIFLFFMLILQLEKSVSKPGKEQQNKCDLISPCQVHCYRAGKVKSLIIVTLKNGVIIRSVSFELTNPS